MLQIRWPRPITDRLPAVSALLLWAAAVGTLTLWWLHLPGPSAPTAAVVRLSPAAPARQATGGLERALGHTRAVAAAPDALKRFQLLGVIASPSGQGSALIAIDGQPAQAFVAGQPVAEGWRLKSVGADSAVLDGGGSLMTLDLPVTRKN